MEMNRMYSTKCWDSGVVDPEDAIVNVKGQALYWHQNVEVSALLALKFGLDPKMS